MTQIKLRNNKLQQLAIYRMAKRQTKLSHHTGSNSLYVTNVFYKLVIEMKFTITNVFCHKHCNNQLI